MMFDLVSMKLKINRQSGRKIAYKWQSKWPRKHIKFPLFSLSLSFFNGISTISVESNWRIIAHHTYLLRHTPPQTHKARIFIIELSCVKEIKENRKEAERNDARRNAITAKTMKFFLLIFGIRPAPKKPIYKFNLWTKKKKIEIQ